MGVFEATKCRDCRWWTGGLIATTDPEPARVCRNAQSPMRVTGPDDSCDWGQPRQRINSPADPQASVTSFTVRYTFGQWRGE